MTQKTLWERLSKENQDACINYADNYPSTSLMIIQLLKTTYYWSELRICDAATLLQIVDLPLSLNAFSEVFTSHE